MGKRKNKDKNEEYIRKKIRKLEKKLRELPETGNDNSVETETVNLQQSPPVMQPQETPSRSEDIQHGPSLTLAPEQDLTIDEDELPEEFLLALGNEGEERKEVGEPIRGELAHRWARLMNCGLGREAREEILKKYPMPENFPYAAPLMNPGIMASLSEITLKRDTRIVARQNITARMMSCLGKALTNLLKGNINSKILIEQINDAAKLAAEVFYQDSSSRKFFALAGANQTVKEAIKDEKSNELLFGKDCGEKIRAAQAIKKTGSQIKNADTTAKHQANSKQNQASSKKQGNWKGPPQYQQHHRGRGGHRQPPRRPYNQPAPPPRDQRHQHRPRTSHRR